MNQKDLFEKLTNAVEVLNSKVDKLQEQVNAKQKGNPFAAKKAGNQTNVKPPTEFDRHLYAATRKNYGDKDFKNALTFFNEFEGKPLSMKQLQWIVYYAAQNHPECKTEIENFLRCELNKRNNFAEAKRDLIEGIKEKYSKFQSHTEYYKAVLSWLEDFK